MRRDDYTNTEREPTVLIIIATGATEGPTRGLFQLVERSNILGFNYSLCNFNATFIKAENVDFFKRARKRHISTHVIQQKWMFDPNVFYQADKIRRDQNCNIVQTHGYKPNVIGFLLKCLRLTPWLAFAHGYTDDNWKIRAYNRIDMMVLRFADKIIAVSTSMKRKLVASGIKSSKIRVIHNAVDKSELKPKLNREKIKRSLGIDMSQLVIGVVGRLSPEKGHILFLRAFRNVLSKLPETTALIIGDGQERKKLREFCATAGLADNVIFTGNVSNVSDYYQSMDILVIPSLSEGLPNVLLESMVLGIPVVASSVGGIPEVIDEDSGILVPPGDHVRLGKEIVNLLRDRPRMEIISKKAKNVIAESFQPEQRAECIASIYSTMFRMR